MRTASPILAKPQPGKPQSAAIRLEENYPSSAKGPLAESTTLPVEEPNNIEPSGGSTPAGKTIIACAAVFRFSGRDAANIPTHYVRAGLLPYPLDKCLKIPEGVRSIIGPSLGCQPFGFTICSGLEVYGSGSRR